MGEVVRQVLVDLMVEGLISDYEDNEDDDFNDKMFLLMMTYNVPDIGRAFFSFFSPTLRRKDTQCQRYRHNVYKKIYKIMLSNLVAVIIYKSRNEIIFFLSFLMFSIKEG